MRWRVACGEVMQRGRRARNSNVLAASNYLAVDIEFDGVREAPNGAPAGPSVSVRRRQGPTHGAGQQVLVSHFIDASKVQVHSVSSS